MKHEALSSPPSPSNRGRAYKDFPPGWGHLQVPTSSREAALAGLSLYAPCRPLGLWGHRLGWLAVSTLGPRALWGAASPLTAQLTSVLESITPRLIEEFEPFDDVAAYHRLQPDRAGWILLLLQGGSPISFLKVREGRAPELHREWDALKSLESFGLRSFLTPMPRMLAQVAGYTVLAVDPLPPTPHRAPRLPPTDLVLREVGAALERIPRPPEAPEHWNPMHGDFTPWNLRVLRDGRLALFDWEAAGWGPSGADQVLYQATAAALRGEPAQRSGRAESVRFWQDRLESRGSRAKQRDQRLLVAVARVLSEMRPPTPRAAPSSPEGYRPRVLVFAYAVEPGRGSEPGAGWGLVQAVASFADCVVLVAPEHREGLARWVAQNPGDHISFETVPEPFFARFAKWHRVPWFMAYQAWLRRAHRLGRALHERQPFDAVHHATYSTYWLPSPLTEFGTPTVWGPVGGAVTTPVALWPALGVRGLLDELLDLVAVRLSALRPATRRTWRGATVRIVQNEETLDRLPPDVRPDALVLNHALFTEVSAPEHRARRPYFVSVSGLEPRKGQRLIVRAMRHADPDIRLVVVGHGPDARSLRRLAERHGVSDRVEFLGRVPRERVFELLAGAAGAVFAGLREEGGLALAEAMLLGTPVVVLANGGARTIAGAATDPARVVLVRPAGVAETSRRLGVAMSELWGRQPRRSGPTLDQAEALRSLRRAFSEALPLPAPPGHSRRVGA